jgi:hypothetical protein
MLGGNVCYHHGGNAPQVKAKAQRRLQQAADALVQRLLGMALDGDAPDHVALAAIRDALDRAGLGAKHAFELSAANAEPAPWEQLMGDVAQLSRAQHEALKRGELLPPPPALPPTEVVDAELEPLPPEMHPEPHEERADGEDRAPDPPRKPAWALDDLGPQPSRELVTLEEAQAEANATNRRARVVRSRRVR